MEVHKHPHHVTHKKKWGEYLLEFSLLSNVSRSGRCVCKSYELFLWKRPTSPRLQRGLNDCIIN